MKNKTAYDYRRYIFLVQFIATSPNEDAVCDLCEKWMVEPSIRYFKNYPAWDRWEYDKGLDYEETFARLAESVIKYYRLTERGK